MQQNEQRKCLYPKTIRLDTTMPQRIINAWDKMRDISGGVDIFSTPNSTKPGQRFTTWPATLLHLGHLFDCMRLTFDGLIACSHALPAADKTNGQDLLHALQRCSRTTIMQESQRQQRQASQLDAGAAPPNKLNFAAFRRELSVNRQAQGVLQQLVATHATENQGKASPVKQGRRKSNKVGRLFGYDFTDLCLDWVGFDGVEETQGSDPFISVEPKRCNARSFADMRDLILHYDQHTLDEIESEQFLETGIMNVRKMFTADGREYLQAPYDPRMRDLLFRVCKHYQQLYFRRLTLGAIGSGQETMSLRLDWDDPFEPGQHLYVSILESKSGCSIPEWPADKRLSDPPDQYHFLMGLGAEQLSVGLKSVRQLEWSLLRLTATHVELKSSDGGDRPASSDEGGGGGENGRRCNGKGPRGRKLVVRLAPRGKKRKRCKTVKLIAEDGTDAQASGSLLSSIPKDFSAEEKRLTLAFWNALYDPACQQDLQRYFAIDESKYTPPVPKKDLLLIMAAIFPLDIRDTLDLPGNEHLTIGVLRKELRLPRTRRRARINVFLDGSDSFQWHKLSEGYLPEDFCERIARADAQKDSRAAQLDETSVHGGVI